MAKYDLKLKTLDAGTQKARTLTLTNVNPEASSNTLKQFTRMLNNLTTNTYDETNLVVTTNLDTETPPIDTRLASSMTQQGDFPLNTINGVGNVVMRLSYVGDGDPYIRVTPLDKTAGNTPLISIQKDSTSGEYIIRTSTVAESQTYEGIKFVYGLTGTDNYKPYESEEITVPAKS